MSFVISTVTNATKRRIRSRKLPPSSGSDLAQPNDPQFAEKLEAIVSLYLNPTEHAIVLCADEKSQIQAMDHSSEVLSLVRVGQIHRCQHRRKVFISNILAQSKRPPQGNTRRASTQ
jgi:hypothetical protein